MRLFTDRRLTFLVVCVALAGIYLSWWTTYSRVHVSARYDQRPAGQMLTTADGTARVVSVLQTPILTGSDAGSKPVEADADAVWVVATVEVRDERANDRTWCAVSLVATTGRVWEKHSADVTRILPSCGDTDAVVGQPYQFEAVFLVPVSDVGAVAGVAFHDPAVVERVPVLSAAS